jgi:Caspase domain
MASSDSATSTEPQIWVFVVGINNEWPYDRCWKGDIALQQAFRRLTGTNVVFVGDSDATTQHVRTQLHTFLQHMNESRSDGGQQQQPVTVMFYFGGHGEQGYFCMAADKHERTTIAESSDNETVWYHKEIVATLESYLRKGDSVWMLVDCCYSGSFVDAFAEHRHNTLQGSYCIVMSTHRDKTAGPDWTLTETWIQAMEGQLPNVSGSFARDGTTGQVLRSTSGSIRRNKNNEMQTLLIGDGIHLDDPFPFRILHSSSSTCLQRTSSSNSLRRSPPSRCRCCWTAFRCCRIPSSAREGSFVRQKAQCLFARNGQFRAYDVPAGTRLWAMWEDHTGLYQGKVLEDDHVPWEKMMSGSSLLDEYTGFMGPYVPVHWDIEKTWSIVPFSHCMFQNVANEAPPPFDRLRSQARLAARAELSRVTAELLPMGIAMECMMRSFHSAGKTFMSANDVVGGTELLCWDREAKAWATATAETLNDCTVDVLATHLDHAEQGDYCIVKWTMTGHRSCLPKKHIRSAS